jgi:hypothetical protein
MNCQTQSVFLQSGLVPKCCNRKLPRWPPTRLERDFVISPGVRLNLPAPAKISPGSRYSANHMISGKLVDSVGDGALVGCVTAGTLVDTVEPSTVS